MNANHEWRLMVCFQAGLFLSAQCYDNAMIEIYDLILKEIELGQFSIVDGSRTQQTNRVIYENVWQSC